MAQSIRDYNTFRVDHEVSSIHQATTIEELRAACEAVDNPIILGDGSNVLFAADIDRPVIVIDMKGITLGDESDRWQEVIVGAGENWHDLVLWALDHDLGGIENLSLIPGKCGAAPMQNIGAYGVEIADTLWSVGVMDRMTGALFNLSKSACKLGYRDSIFKNEYKGQYIITSIKLRLSKAPHHKLNLSYGDIKKQLSDQGISEPTIKDVSKAVIAIRESKLPDPKKLPNAGSFFKNPVIPIHQYDELKNKHSDMPSYPVSDAVCKVPAGWLIDRAGWKGVMLGEVGVHAQQALVIVNHGAKDGKQILELSKMIQKSVFEKYGINLNTEVNLFRK